MAQPSVLRYFNCRKRPALDDHKLDRPAKLLKPNEEHPKLAPQKRQNVDLNCNKPVQESTVVEEKAVLKSTDSTERCFTPPPRDNVEETEKSKHPCLTPPPKNIIGENKQAKDLSSIKANLCKSKKLAQLKKSLEQFKQSSEKLDALGKRNELILQSLKQKSPVKLPVSPRKLQSPEKLSLSPIDSKPGLQLPFKYRTLSEIFRAVDTIAQIMHNRQEAITFKKLKPAVEELAKRTFHKTHLAQIKSVYPTAYDFAQRKFKSFAQEEWDLVLTPTTKTQNMTTQDLLARRRQFHGALLDKVKNHHTEFLSSLTPPLVIAKHNLTRWHPEFALEKVPDVELASLPETPTTEIHTSGKQILESARRLFNSNVRHSPVTNLGALFEKQEQTTTVKGIPEALLRKVREKQASKALMAMTKSAEKEKEMQVCGRLPEIARFVRNLFVTERKAVLPLDVVLEKLGNSYRTNLNKSDMEHHLKVISTKVPGWLVFHKVRNCVFIKLDKNADLSGVLNKLEKLVTEMKETQ